ncbi:outer envelope protein 39, chloroplastic-like [Gastrolobium bilobum]|uniref:outer envelope protein 39, chloroplastic-like n=1 Tax=Gastrolobium bilobum TaxID=150636 RepID=UPI002AAFB509|nr:outer envelope protein 39, chloroplastic-like [Gastrolobium bilobum]
MVHADASSDLFFNGGTLSSATNALDAYAIIAKLNHVNDDRRRMISKIRFGFNLFSKLCSSYMLSHRRISSTLLSLASNSLHLKHPGLFGKSDIFDVWWHDDGLDDLNILIAYRFPIAKFDRMRCLTIQYSVSPEVRIHGMPVNNFSHSVSQDLRLFNLSIGLHMNAEASFPNWIDTTSASLKTIHFMDDGGSLRSLDMDGFPMTRSGTPFESTIVLKHESRFAEAKDRHFTHFNLQVEQGFTLHPNLLSFLRFKFFASEGTKLGPALLSYRCTGGSIVGSFAPHHAFAIGGPSSVRGYGEGAVATGQSCLVSTSELAIPLHHSSPSYFKVSTLSSSLLNVKTALSLYLWQEVKNLALREKLANTDENIFASSFTNKKLTGVIFLDLGSDLRTSRLVPGNPGRRQGKPGSGFGFGYGIRFNTQWAEINVDYAINDFQKRTVYFGFSNLIPC